MTITSFHAGPRMSQAVIHGVDLYLAGQVADPAKGKSVAEQTKEILATIDRLLARSGIRQDQDPVHDDLSRRHRRHSPR